MSETKPCRFVATDQPRAIRDEHLRDCNVSGCPGCKPCPERHCLAPGCPGRHLTAGENITCARCVGYVRADLAEILRLCGTPLHTEAEHRGVNSEAAMLIGPAANREAWGYRAMSAMFGRLSDAYLEDCRDEAHPLWVLGGWEAVWRRELDHETDGPVTIEDAGAYLDQQLTYMAQREEPDFAQFANEVRRCRGHCEDVAREGERAETGAPCPMCGNRALVKHYGDRPEDDRWQCPDRDCAATYTEGDYRAKVEAVYVREAKALTASQIRDVYRVKEGTLRRWASGWMTAAGWQSPVVRKRGKDRFGLTLYDVADTLAARDGEAERESA